MLIRRCPGPCPLVDLGSLNPPAQCVRRDTELLPNPRTHPASATGVVSRIKHKTNRTPAKLFSDIYVVLPLVPIHFRGIKNLHSTRGETVPEYCLATHGEGVPSRPDPSYAPSIRSLPPMVQNGIDVQ